MGRCSLSGVMFIYVRFGFENAAFEQYFLLWYFISSCYSCLDSWRSYLKAFKSVLQALKIAVFYCLGMVALFDRIDSLTASAPIFFLAYRFSHMKNICILGATGSIGLNTLEVISLHPDKYKAYLYLAQILTGKKCWKLCKLHKPAYAVMVDPNSAEHLHKLVPEGVTVLSGEKALTKVAAHKKTDYVMAAIVGSAGMSSTLAAAEVGQTNHVGQ